MRIAWEKWKNPYKPLKRKQGYNDGYDSNTSQFDSDDEEHDGEEEDNVDGPNIVFYTPLGPVPLTNENNPEKLFNFWVGHTNFDITEKVKDILNEAVGVEVLTIYTRYRFRIGIGQLFIPKRVMNGIEKSIGELFNEKQEPSSGVDIDGPRQGDTAGNKRNLPT
jgi:hypothetical protein